MGRATTTILGPRNRERGSAIILALVILTPVLVVGGAILGTLTSYQREVDTHALRVGAQSISTSAAHDAIVSLNLNPELEGTYEYQTDHGAALVSVTDWGTDLVDNDESGWIDDQPEQGFVEIRAEGWLSDGAQDWQRSVVTVLVHRVTGGVKIDQALYLDDPYAEIDLGTGNRISGADKAGLEESLPAVGVPGTTDVVEKYASLSDSLTMEGVASTEPVDIDGQIERWSSLATRTISTDHALKDTILGTQNQPVVLHAMGDLELGQIVGYGVLIVDGDFRADAVDFQGLIIVRGKVRLDANNTLKGSVWVGGDSDTSDPILRMGSENVVRFDSAAAQAAAALVGDAIEVVSWSQDNGWTPAIEDYPTDPAPAPDDSTPVDRTQIDSDLYVAPVAGN